MVPKATPKQRDPDKEPGANVIWEPEKRGERRRQSAGSRRWRSGEGWPLGSQDWEGAVLVGQPGASDFSAPQRPVWGHAAWWFPKDQVQGQVWGSCPGWAGPSSPSQSRLSPSSLCWRLDGPLEGSPYEIPPLPQQLQASTFGHIPPLCMRAQFSWYPATAAPALQTSAAATPASLVLLAVTPPHQPSPAPLLTVPVNVTGC